MSGFENLPTEVLRMVFGMLDSDTLLKVAQVSSNLNEQAMSPEVWKERLDEVAGEGQWGRDPSGHLELLRQERFSKVLTFVLAGTEAVTAEHWDQLVVEMELRGSRDKIGILVSGNLSNISSTSLARLVEACHCVDIGSCEELSDTAKNLLLVAIGSPSSRVRHCRMKGTRFGNDPAVTFHVENIVGKTWEFLTDESCFTGAQLSGINWAMAGNRRTDEAPPGNCGLVNCKIILREEEEKARMERIANDFHSFFNELMSS